MLFSGLMEDPHDSLCLQQAQNHGVKVLEIPALIRTLPNQEIIENARSSMLERLPHAGVGIDQITTHLMNDIAPALNGSSLSPNYYGFVTGGTTPAARVAESLVSLYDQNVQVHLPQQTIATDVEDRALELLLDLFHLERKVWKGRTLTTGATSSNILGLACGREWTINERIRVAAKTKPPNVFKEMTVGEAGMLAACRNAEIDETIILTTMPHSSIRKASSVVGIGRASVLDVADSSEGVAFDMDKLKDCLKVPRRACIIVVSCGEINTGMFATHGYHQFRALRKLCDRYNAWLHVDGAFGMFTRVLDNSSEFEYLKRGTEGLELADSVTVDGHKLLNMPYDCGFFFCRHEDVLPHVFQNPNAIYLNSGSSGPDTITSPLNAGIENSRRFRALPVYASLIAYGREGYRDMLQRQSRFARAVALHIIDHPDLELLVAGRNRTEKIAIANQSIFIVVLFRAQDKERDTSLNNSLVNMINESSRVYVSGTFWHGYPACRIAVSNWQVDPDRDLNVVRSVLSDVISRWQNQGPA